VTSIKMVREWGDNLHVSSSHITKEYLNRKKWGKGIVGKIR